MKTYSFFIYYLWKSNLKFINWINVNWIKILNINNNSYSQNNIIKIKSFEKEIIYLI